MNLYTLYCRGFQKITKTASSLWPWGEPELLKGPGSLAQLPSLIKSLGLRRVLLVTDPGLMRLELPKPLLQGLEAVGIYCALYSKTAANPSYDHVQEACALYRETNCEGIVAFGGGSPMDCAKLAAMQIAYPNMPLKQMVGLHIKLRTQFPPVFAVPTTAGTGSETTIAAVVTDPATHEKHTVFTPKLRPRYAVLDPSLTLGLPPAITAQTGMDALTHALEAYIGQSNTPETEEKALRAVKLVFENLESAVQDGSNMEARENMLQASYYGGQAFTRAYVGYIHGIAHALGGKYDLPHGLACAIVMPYVLDFYGEAAHARLADLAAAAGLQAQDDSPAAKAAAMIQGIRDLNASIGIPAALDSIRQEDIPAIAARALKESNPLYPVPKIMRQSECEGLLRAMQG